MCACVCVCLFPVLLSGVLNLFSRWPVKPDAGMKSKQICLCLFAVSDALLDFLIRMPKPSRVGTDCFFSLSLFLYAMICHDMP